MNILDRTIKNHIVHGDFTLSSGAKSNYYIDLRKLMMCRFGLDLVGPRLAKAVQLFHPQYVGGMATAAIPVVTAILSHCYDIYGFYIREKSKLHGLQHQVEGHLKKGSEVVIVDDVATSGGSIARAIEIVVRDFECKVVGAVCILDRMEGAGELLARMDVPFVALATLKDVLCSDE